jgi:hypothetical protein
MDRTAVRAHVPRRARDAPGTVDGESRQDHNRVQPAKALRIHGQIRRLVRPFEDRAAGMRRANAGLLRLIVRLGAAALVAAGGVGLAGLPRVGVHQGYEPEQPIAFSHQLHAGESQIPCLYCHFIATRSRHAGIPPVSVCMNCHGMLTKRSREIQKLLEAAQQRRPVAWTAVHTLPDFVYFNHSRHLLAGVACAACHGPVETMTRVRQDAPLTMGWCLDCHRQRAERQAAAHGREDGGLAAGNRSLECSSCHY